MSENYYNDDESEQDEIEQNADDENADAEVEQDADAAQDQDGDVDRFGGTGLTTSDLTELTPFDAEALSGMSDSEVAFLAETTAQNHTTDGSLEAYIDAITATLAQVEPEHEWADSAALRDHADDVEDLKRIAGLIENGRGVAVVERAEGNVGPASDGTLANHRKRQQQAANANAASGKGVNTNSAHPDSTGGGDFGLNPSEWGDSGASDTDADDGPATTGTLADYRDRQARVNTNAASDGTPASLRVGQRTVHHGEDAYYAEVRRRKKKGDWPHSEPSGFHDYRQRLEAKEDENSGV